MYSVQLMSSIEVNCFWYTEAHLLMELSGHSDNPDMSFCCCLEADTQVI